MSPFKAPLTVWTKTMNFRWKERFSAQSIQRDELHFETVLEQQWTSDVGARWEAIELVKAGEDETPSVDKK